QCDGCVVANDSHSKIDELDAKIKTLECLYQNLNSKFADAFPNNGDAKQQSSNVTVGPHKSQTASQSYAAATSSSLVQGLAPQSSNAGRDDFVTVQNKRKKNNNNKNKTVVGVAPASKDLQVLQSIKYLHVGKFNAATDPETVSRYVASKLNVDPKTVSCFRLVKTDIDFATLKFINLKLGVPVQHYDEVLNDKFWPCSVKVKRFVHRERINKEDTIIELAGPARSSTPTSLPKNPQ
ncbi:hypothetical protein KR054_006245, partial [Drosophila jambulina]